MKLIWTPEAYADRDAIWLYISQDNPVAAAKLDEKFSEAAKNLTDIPFMGKEGMIKGTRELLPHPNYRMVYEVHDDTIWILAIVHCARRWPK